MDSFWEGRTGYAQRDSSAAGGDGSVRVTAGIPSARRDWAYDGHANGALRGDGLG